MSNAIYSVKHINTSSLNENDIVSFDVLIESKPISIEKGVQAELKHVKEVLNRFNTSEYLYNSSAKADFNWVNKVATIEINLEDVSSYGVGLIPKLVVLLNRGRTFIYDNMETEIVDTYENEFETQYSVIISCSYDNVLVTEEQVLEEKNRLKDLMSQFKLIGFIEMQDELNRKSSLTINLDSVTLLDLENSVKEFVEEINK